MKKISGFTLLELIVAILVLGIVLATGIPAFQDFMKAGQITTFNNELVSSMHVARSSAIQLASPGCVCASANAGTAAPSCSGSNNWEDGWIAFVDTNTTATDVCVYNSGDDDVLLKIWDGASSSSDITVRSDSTTINAVDYVRFNNRGVPVTAQGVSMQGMFKICDDRGLTDGSSVLGRGVILSASGSLRTTKTSSVISSCL